MKTVNVVIVDDHPLFRQGVVDTISLEEGFQVVGEAADGEEALELIREVKPDVVVLDVNLPAMNGLQVARILRKEGATARVVLVTAYDDAEQIIHAVRAGAAAYCPKHIRPEELVDVIRYVSAGNYVIDGAVLQEWELAGWLARYISQNLGSYREAGEPLHSLSDREMEVLSYVTQGLGNKEIAVLLGISYQTVKNHVTSILRKLDVDDRTQAAVYALRRGWFRLYDDGLDTGGTATKE